MEVHLNHGLMFGLGSNRESTCPNEFTSIFVQESLILTLGAKGNWIRNFFFFKKATERYHSFCLLPWWSQTTRFLLQGKFNGQWSFLGTSSLRVLAKTVVFNFFVSVSMPIPKKRSKFLVICESYRK